jgi:hypothetical protein
MAERKGLTTRGDPVWGENRNSFDIFDPRWTPHILGTIGALFLAYPFVEGNPVHTNEMGVNRSLNTARFEAKKNRSPEHNGLDFAQNSSMLGGLAFLSGASAIALNRYFERKR